MKLVADDPPISDVGEIDDEIMRRIGSYMSGSPAPDDLAEIRRLSRRRSELTTPKVFEEAHALIARIAAVRQGVAPSVDILQ